MRNWTFEVRWCVWMFGGWYSRKHGHGGLQIGPFSWTWIEPMMMEDE